MLTATPAPMDPPAPLPVAKLRAMAAPPASAVMEGVLVAVTLRAPVAAVMLSEVTSATLAATVAVIRFTARERDTAMAGGPRAPATAMEPT